MKYWVVWFGIFYSMSGWADRVENLLELARLPTYCRGTQQIREISRDPVPIEEYQARYGFSYSHMHHYCWALNSENKANSILDPAQRKSKLFYALGDIDYVLRNASPNFVFLPEVYTGKARILFQLHQDAEAVSALRQALELKPAYWPASLRLSDYHKRQGEIENARKILEKALEHTPNSKILNKRLAELGAKKK